MYSSLIGALEMGLLYAFMALGVYITFRILDFPDLTVDGSFTTGGAIAAVMITHGYSPLLATVCALLGGMAAGMCTGLLHTKGKINGLLSGILMMIALYSINLRILVRPNVSLMGEVSLFSSINPLLVMPFVVLLVKILMDLFLRTDLGLALRATGDNSRMIRSFGVNTDTTTILGISLANGMVALSGALIAQYSTFADSSMGIGMIVIGLASVIIGEAIFGAGNVFRATLAVVLGSIVYRIVVALALRVPWLKASDLKLITAIIVIIALVFPSVQRFLKQKTMARRRTEELAELTRSSKKGGAADAKA
ncbi:MULTISPECIES: ABC transporter permease [Paenibacillus]|jgi:putative tryptophan/tyrosine transport system permease protein|uniref:ABC transporter permease n=1 Tax=Paenibacillus phytohabitans TaxID=2654978 RepID=A0ABX1YCP6_9BACL|nr:MULTISPECIES: ABC transporter permease [Paenibacillus]AIQ29489.1 ABC transporter permease [Paenibacillus sp. FSL P4-0081]AIQ41181.1 ABC transporter permease [Paenibacillus sp. FSL R5-0912]NOU78299.1 ABC transporter permease [Paenibacillus phytohabitans]OMF26005.1 ABC transporter permease [Paenibacillus sp. FSL H8-0259]